MPPKIPKPSPLKLQLFDADDKTGKPLMFWNKEEKKYDLAKIGMYEKNFKGAPPGFHRTGNFVYKDKEYSLNMFVNLVVEKKEI